MTPQEATEAAGRAAASARELNHLTRPGAAGLDVTDVYDILAELVLLASRLPQALVQLDAIVDRLVEDGQVVIVDGDYAGDPVAAAATMGHWIEVARDGIDHATIALDHAQQALTWAARTSS